MRMGKIHKFLILLALSSTHQSWAQGITPSPDLNQDAEFAAQKLTGGLIQIADDRRIENQITNSSGFNKCRDDFRKAVKANPNKTTDFLTIDSCKTIIPSKKEELADLVKKINPISEALNFQKDANYKAVYSYMNERLETALYGDKANPNDQKLHLVDHKNFYELYKSQISRKFLLDTSSYCMEVFGPKANANDTRAADDVSYDYKKWMEDKIKAGNAKDIGDEFQTCLVSIPCNCFGGLDAAKYCPSKDKAGKGTGIKYVSDDKVKQQACLLTSRLKALKQEMLALKQIDEGYNQLGAGGAINSNNVVKYDPTEKEKSADDLTLIGTDDYTKASAELDTKTKEFKKKCDNPTVKLTDAECSDLSTIDSNKYADVQLEYQLKTKALADNIEQMDADKLKEYLKDQKKTDAEITQLFADHNQDFKAIKDQIKNQVKTEREQIIKEIADQINQNSVITDNDNSKNTLNANSKVRTVAENQVERTKRLIQYNNIVTAYLSTSSGSGKGHYTKGLEREIASESSGGKKDEDYFKQLRDQQKILSKDSSDAGGGATLLDVSTIDTILGNSK